MARYAFLFLSCMALMSCSKDESAYDIGEDFVSLNTNLHYVDTFSINSYTVKLDSITSSGYGKILVGKYSDSELGTLRSHSFFQLGLPYIYAIPDNSEYDNAQLILVSDGYSAGDTLSRFSMSLHRLLSQPSTVENGYFYNTSNVPYEPEPAGEISVYPRPSLLDTLKMPMDNTLGKDLFTKFSNHDDEVSSESSFLNYLKGFALLEDNTDQSVMRFSATDSSLYLRINFHYPSYETMHSYLDLPLYNSADQFNYTGRENSFLDSLSNQRVMFPSSTTGDVTFVQGGNPVVTRLEFPSLNKLPENFHNIKVVKAEIILVPEKNTYKNIPLPAELALYETDNYNRFVSGILDNTGSLETGVLNIDDMFNEQTTYTFDVTQWADVEIHNHSDNIPALLVTLPPGNGLNSSFSRVVLNASRHAEYALRLKIYYINYD